MQRQLGVDPSLLRPIEFDEPTDVMGVRVVAIGANHCPGAAMLHFTMPDGRTVLHTGDFRYQHYMADHPTLAGRPLTTLYLDTT